MSEHDDSSSWPSWLPPGEDAPPPPPPPPAATDAIDPSASPPVAAPPPPPPGAWSGAPSTAGPGGPDWTPPPPRRTGTLVVAVVIGVLVLLAAGAAAVVLVRVSDGDQVLDAGDLPDAVADADPDDVVAQTEAVLQVIDQSEERMIGFQVDLQPLLEEDGTVGDGAEGIANAARDAAEDLLAIRTTLRGLAGGEADGFDGLRDIRDTYAGHMDAWVDYLDAVAGSPAMAGFDSADADPFWGDIESTGDDFVEAVRTGLPDGTPSELRDYAEFIVDRGFGGFDQDPGGQFV